MQNPKDSPRDGSHRSKSGSGESNSIVAARFIARAPVASYEPAVLEAARMALVDWFGVAIGARDEPAAGAVRRTAEAWRAPGRARLLLGGCTAPALAALVNGTMAHCLDFDDTHVGAASHLGAPTAAATLALAAEHGLSGMAALDAFITGFEVGARIGHNGFGEGLTGRGVHATGVLGRLAAAAAASRALGLDSEQAGHALGLAATQAAGLTGSFGTMAKPFHAGKAAMDGVLSAQLAAQQFAAAPSLVDSKEGAPGLAGSLIQDGSLAIGPLELSEGWELTRNTFKPYASCLLTHPAIDAARELAPQLDGTMPTSVRVRAHPLALKVANIEAPSTPLEGKFSIAFCVALALCGHAAQAGDFSEALLADHEVRATMERVQVQNDDTLSLTASAVEVSLPAGQTLHVDVPIGTGNPERPMGWDAMETKFMALVEPALGARASRLLTALRRIEQPGALDDALKLVAGEAT